MSTVVQAKKLAVEAALSVADEVAKGVVSARDLEGAAEAECRALFGMVVGVGDPLWGLHVDVARQVLSLGGVPANELAEWLAVARGVNLAGPHGAPAATLTDEQGSGGVVVPEVWTEAAVDEVMAWPDVEANDV